MRIRDVSGMLTRDGQPLLLFRSGSMAIKDKDKRIVEVTLSSETPVERWGDKEILSHAPGAVRLDRLREVGAFHLYHDTTKPVAAIKSADVRDGKTVVLLQFGRTDIANQAWMDVEDNILRGTSAGYRVHKVQIDEEARTITAIDWEPYEGSFTTIPADPNVGVGRSADQETLWRSLTTNAATPAPKEKPVKYFRAVMALIIAHRHLEAEILARGEKLETDEQLAGLQRWAAEQPKPAATTPVTPPGDEKQRAEELRVAGLHLSLVRQAQTFQITLADEDLAGVRSADAGAALILRKMGEKHETRPTQQVSVQVTADGTDKRRDAAVDGLLASTFGLKAVGEGKDLGMRRKSPCEILRALIPDLRDADKDQVAKFACGKRNELNLRDANQSAANFTAVLGNYADKAVMLGFNSAARTHELWTSERLVDDFKDVYGAAVAAGLLKEQSSKGAPADEMNLTEKSYNSSLGLFMRSIKFTYQDWRNDDLGLFADLLRQAGVIAANTEEWQVYKALVEATWTNYITTTAAYWDDTNDRLKYTGFGATLADLEGRKLTVGDESVQLNPVLGFVLAPPKRAHAARAILGNGPVGTAPMAVPVPGGAQVISAPWLANSTLSGYSADDYFLIAKNMDVIKVLRDRLFPAPRVVQLEAGATLDQHFLVAHAFRAKLASQEGAQKGDWS